MALINNLYVTVTDEEVAYDIDSTSHPVEKGIPITDTIRRKPIGVSLSGYIVDVNNIKAETIIKTLRTMETSGSLIKYVGSEIVSNQQIQSFKVSRSNEVWGGCTFTMELQEVRIAKSSYTAPKKTQTTTNTQKKETVIKVGSIVVFKGGNVYVSSDAKKVAAKRGRSTCKVTIISKKSWSVHQYHLISTDGGKVYGWVDKSNIEGATTSSKTATKTNSGTQQVNSTSGNAVYHTVKKGDTVWALVNKSYKSLGKSCQWVIDNNPKAFSRKGDPTTLQIGAKLLVGYKS